MRKTLLLWIFIFVYGFAIGQAHGFVFSAENTTSAKMLLQIFSVDHGMKDYADPINIITAEMPPGKIFKSTTDRKAGRYMIIWYNIESGVPKDDYMFKIWPQEGVTKVHVTPDEVTGE